MANKPALKKSLLIGLGGTGVKSILYAKAKILSIYGEIPSMVRFLALDTDKFEPVTIQGDVTATLEANEYVHMQVPDGLQFIRANDHASAFFPEKNLKNAGAIVRGAGQIRSLGRLALMRNYAMVQKRISEEILQLKKYSVGYDDKFDVSGNDLQISVVCSTSGGTGAGTFIDIPYIIKNTGELTNQDRIIAYLLMPDIFKQYSGTRNVEPNCYASFKELDFIMDGNLSGTKIDYGRQQLVPIDGHPYDIIFTINNTNNNNDAYTETSDLQNFIGTGLFLSTGIIAEKGDSTWDNLGKQIDDFLKVENKAPHYTSFGISELFYDGAILSEIYARKLALSIINRMTGTVESLTNEVNDKIDQWKIRENNEVDDVVDAILPRTTNRAPESLTEIGKGASVEIQTLASNYINVITDIAEKEATTKVETLLTDKLALIEAHFNEVLNRENGLSYSQNFVETFLGIMDVCKSEMEIERKRFLQQREKIVGSYKNFIADIEEAEESFFMKRKNNIQLAAEDYYNEVRREATIVHEIRRRDKAYYFYSRIIQFVEEKKLKFESLHKDLHSVIRSFEEFVQRKENARGNQKPFIINLHEDYFDKTSPKPEDVSFNDFVNTINEKEMPVYTWPEIKIEELENLLLNYTTATTQAKSFLQNNLDSVLRNLPVERRRQIIKDLDRRAEPLWRYNKSYILDTATIYLIGIENQENSALFDVENGRELIETIPGRKTYAVTNENNRVYFYKMEAACPAFTIFNMQAYRQKYDNPQARYDYHIDRHWAKAIEDKGFDLFPSGDDEDIILCWALGNAFGFVNKEGRKAYNVKSFKEGTPTSDYWVSLNSEDRKEAFVAFSKRKYFREVNELLEKHVAEKGNEAYAAHLEDYTNNFMDRIKEFTTLDEKTIQMKGYAEVKDLIDKELTILKKYMAGLKSGF